jgi:hypothetical protein
MILKTRRIVVQSGFPPVCCRETFGRDSRMKTTKACLAGLGTTGIMIVDTLLLVVLGTGFAAFDSGTGGEPAAAFSPA